MKSLFFWISEIAFLGDCCCCYLSLCFQTACCLVCIMDLCSNSHIYLCSHLNVAAKHELLKEKKTKERGKQSNAGIALSVDEDRFLLCVQNISLSSMGSSQRALSVQCVLMEISEVQRHGERKNLDLCLVESLDHFSPIHWNLNWVVFKI